MNRLEIEQKSTAKIEKSDYEVKLREKNRIQVDNSLFVKKRRVCK